MILDVLHIAMAGAEASTPTLSVVDMAEAVSFY